MNSLAVSSSKLGALYTATAAPNAGRSSSRLPAAELLADTRHPKSKDRLVACARRAMHLTSTLPMPPTWNGFNFYEAVLRFEARVIERALRDAGGIVARAAQLLGIRRLTLDTMLHDGRHNDLARLRAPVEPRKSSLMFREECCAETQPVTILHVEDSPPVTNPVKETLGGEGWTVETCVSGAAAIEKLSGISHYDLLIFNNQLPDMSGVELTRQTRGMAHRQQTPIIMLSGEDVER